MVLKLKLLRNIDLFVDPKRCYNNCIKFDGSDGYAYFTIIPLNQVDKIKDKRYGLYCYEGLGYIGEDVDVDEKYSLKINGVDNI
jgi:hypothetical protein